MNLIEQLGGYDSAKAAALNYRNSGDALTAKKFEYACLEHRRQHNIFEVGDKVVFREKHNEVFSYSHYSEGLDLHFFESESNYGHMDINKVRHATPEEIKAGHRL